jgi:hypothetical protein
MACVILVLANLIDCYIYVPFRQITQPCWTMVWVKVQGKLSEVNPLLYFYTKLCHATNVKAHHSASRHHSPILQKSFQMNRKRGWAVCFHWRVEVNV